MIYCYPTFVRSSGLGNRLFPWARCAIYSHTRDVPMLAPRWGHLRKAAFFRGGVDYRNFARKTLLWGNFRPAPNEILGIRRARILATAERLGEPENSAIHPASQSEEQLVIFSGDRNHFIELREWKSFLSKRLMDITHSRWLATVERYKDIEIGINVRCGKDFTEAKTVSDFFTRGAVRTPLNWYIDTLQQIREGLGWPAKAFVVSDGTPDNLRDLLAMQNIEFVKSDSAISDLLILAKSRVLIGSGGSSFSAWAAFLSRAPTVTHPGQSLQWFKVADEHSQFVGEFDCEKGPPPGLIGQIENALA